jgi:hypothetical protein
VAQASRRALVSVLFRGVVRRGSTGYPAPIHRAAAGPALNPKFPAYPGLNSGACAGALVNWFANTVAGATFLTLLNTLGHAQTFWLYAVMNAAFVLLTLWLIPEAKGVSFEQIERNLMAAPPAASVHTRF